MKRVSWLPTVLVTAALLAFVVPVEVMAGRSTTSMVLTVILCLCGGLGWRYPLLGGGLFVLAEVLNLVSGQEMGLVVVAGIVPILAATLKRSRWGLLVNFAGQSAVFIWLAFRRSETTAQTIMGLNAAALTLLPPYFVGRLVLFLVDRAERMRAQQEERMIEERRQLARDLHDTIVYATTTMVMRSEDLRRRKDLPPEVEAELAIIADTGRNATRGLRDLLSLLRQSGDIATTVKELKPGALDAVVRGTVEKLRAAGFDAHAHVSGELGTLSTQTSNVLGALLVESSSNVVKHGTRDAPCSLFLEVEGDAVELAVINGTFAHEVEREHEPLGLVGMSERVEQVGGHFSAGRSGDSFLVEAKLSK